MIRSVLLLMICCFVFSVQAQVDYAKQYKNGKDLFLQGKYNLAMETFKPLTVYDQNNHYEQYASFYYALAAYKQGYRAVAKDMFNQIRSRYAKWDQINEVNFWLGKVHLDNKDYFQALKIFSQISGKGFQKNIDAAKKTALAAVSDVETLRMMHEEYPKDEVIAKVLARELSKNISDDAERVQLEDLIAKFQLNRSEYFAVAPKTFHKDKYSVSVLMPFMMSTLDPSPGRKRNQIILDFYEGMKLAVDTLNGMGIDLSLRAYDTERNPEKLKMILGTEELRNTDLIVGPFFQEEITVVQDFSLNEKVNMVHPFTNNSDVLGNNPHAFLFQPAAETLGKESAAYLDSKILRKNSMVFYGTGKKDSAMAASFIMEADTNGLNVVHAQETALKDLPKILEILATPTEFDEFDYPSEFTLKKDSLGSIYVAADDALIYAKVISAVESRADSILVIGSESWLDDPALDPEKYQNLGVVLTAPNFTGLDNPAYRDFFHKFIRRYGRTPNTFAKIGFELMMFFGQQLEKHGVFFQEGLTTSGIQPGYLYQGFDYRFGRDNQLIPFVTFKNGQLILLEKR
ncbi:MAG TPA: hypothetical protein VD927_15270 [Chryseosolibacter sp.]|nr:hypothetical protein [Chryseosolibacter sp.]